MKPLLLNSELIPRLDLGIAALSALLEGDSSVVEMAGDALAELTAARAQLAEETKDQEYWAKQARRRKGYPTVVLEYDTRSGAFLLWNFAGELICTVYNYQQLVILMAAEAKQPGTIQAVTRGRDLKAITRTKLKAALNEFLKKGKIRRAGKVNVKFEDIEDLL